MKILIPNTFYYYRGGASTYTFNLSNLLQRKGHTVIPFAMEHHMNLNSYFSRYFVSNVNFPYLLKKRNLKSLLEVITRAIYSLEAKNKINTLLKTELPNLLHMQEIHHHITLSILHVFKKYHLPIVWTLHDYALICPNTSFLNDGKICEYCHSGTYYRAIINRCKKNSLTASIIAATESYFNLLFKMYAKVDVFIAPSKFLRNKFIDYGFNGKQIVHIPNFIETKDVNISSSNTDYILYSGRLSYEKGLKTLIEQFH